MTMANWLAQHDVEQLTLADGLEDALVGLVHTFDGVPVAVYDYETVIDVLCRDDAMTADDATEYFDFNIRGSYVGKQTPLFLHRYTRDHDA